MSDLLIYFLGIFKTLVWFDLLSFPVNFAKSIHASCIYDTRFTNFLSRYDAHVLDPLANLQFTTGTYYMLASSIKELAKDLCRGRCVFFLEGGYNLSSLSHSVADSFRAFLGEPSLAAEFDDPAFLYEEPSDKVKEAIQKVQHIHSL